MKNRLEIKLFPADVVNIFVASAVLLGILLLPLKGFNAYVAVAGAALITITIILYTKPLVKEKRLGKLFIPILLIALFLRIPPYQYILGGQDQGTYMNIAHQYAKNKTLYAVDNYREKLSQNERGVYDYYGNYIMPSIEKWNRKGSEYSMVFYPAFPTILGIGEKTLGQNSMQYTLTFISLLSIVNIGLTTIYATKSKNASLLVMLFLATNPIHVFFSKFTVGEIAALNFLAMGYYYLLRGTQSKCYNLHFFVLSLLGFFVFAMTRMTFFLHIPIIFTIGMTHVMTKEKRTLFAMYGAFTLVIISVSTLYYKFLLNPLYARIYPGTLPKLVNDYIPTSIPNNLKITVIAIFLLSLLIINIRHVIRTKTIAMQRIIYVLFILVSIALLTKLTAIDLNYVLNTESTNLERWNISGRGLDAIKHVTLFAISNYICITLFSCMIGAAIYTVFVKRLSTLHLLTGFSIYFLLIYVEKTWLVRYDYYNSRYFLTEVIPMILITCSYILDILIKHSKTSRAFSFTIISLTLCYFCVFSYFQLGKFEGNSNDFYKKLVHTISKEDLIIIINENIDNNLYSQNFNDYMVGPLKYYYDRNVLLLENRHELGNWIVKDIVAKHENTYYISNILLGENATKITLKYNYFNNSPGCNFHNYEFLDTKRVTEIPLPDFLKCKLLPNAYFEKERNYYFGKYK